MRASVLLVAPTSVVSAGGNDAALLEKLSDADLVTAGGGTIADVDTSALEMLVATTILVFLVEEALVLTDAAPVSDCEVA